MLCTVLSSFAEALSKSVGKITKYIKIQFFERNITKIIARILYTWRNDYKKIEKEVDILFGHHITMHYNCCRIEFFVTP